MKVFITGSTTGLGHLAGEILRQEGHEVVLHARNKKSAQPQPVPYVYGDLAKLEEVKALLREANELGPFDAIIHNAGVYTSSPEELFAVNVLAPYVLSKSMNQPSRLVFLSSGMHLSGKMVLDPKKCSYSDTKLFDLMLAKYFARIWPNTLSNAVDPGWVPTRMGGAGAPDDLRKGAETQAWLSVTDEKSTLVSGQYFHHKKVRESNPLADSVENQNALIAFLEKQLV